MKNKKNLYKFKEFIEPIYRQTYIDLNTIREQTILEMFNKKTVIQDRLVKSPGIGIQMRLNNELIVESSEKLGIDYA